MNFSVCEHCYNNPKNNPLASGICYCNRPYTTATTLKPVIPDDVKSIISKTGNPRTEGRKSMSEIKITEERIDRLMKTAEYHVITEFEKCTIVSAKLENGFILTESSACVDPENYDEERGVKICKDKIRERLWELEGYALQKAVHRLKKEA